MDELVNLFTKEHGYYKRRLQFNVVIIIFVIIILFSKIFKNNSNIIILLSFSLFLANIFVKSKSTVVNDVNEKIFYKLQSLQEKTFSHINYKIKLTKKINTTQDLQRIYEKNTLDSLYIDSNLIDFLYSVITLYDYNPEEFFLLLKGVNNILKLRKSIEDYQPNIPQNIAEMLETAIQLKVNVLNNFQNFIYTIPKINKMNKYLNTSIVELNKLLTNNINIIHNYSTEYIKINGINNMTKFTSVNETKPFDQLSNYSLVPTQNSQNQSKLIDLYV